MIAHSTSYLKILKAMYKKSDEELKKIMEDRNSKMKELNNSIVKLNDELKQIHDEYRVAKKVIIERYYKNKKQS